MGSNTNIENLDMPISQYLEIFKEHFAASVGAQHLIHIVADDTQNEVRIILQYDSLEPPYNGTLRMKSIVQALLPLLRMPLGRVTVAFKMGNRCDRKSVLRVFYSAMADLAISLSELFKKGAGMREDGLVPAILEEPPYHDIIRVKHISFAVQPAHYNSYGNNTVATEDTIDGDQYTCSEHLWKFWERHFPEHPARLSLDSRPFVYSISNDSQREFEFGLVTPGEWTARGARAVQRLFDETDDTHIVGRSCFSCGIGKEVVASGDEWMKSYPVLSGIYDIQGFIHRAYLL